MLAFSRLIEEGHMSENNLQIYLGFDLPLSQFIGDVPLTVVRHDIALSREMTSNNASIARIDQRK